MFYRRGTTRRYLSKNREYDSKFEKKLHEGILKGAEFHPDRKVEYSVPKTYEPDFVLTIGKHVFFIEAKGVFDDAADARIHRFKAEAVEQIEDGNINHFIFLFQRLKTAMPGARKRKDGTRFTVQEWAVKWGLKHCDEKGIEPLIQSILGDTTWRL